MSAPETDAPPSVPTVVVQPVWGELPEDRTWRAFPNPPTPHITRVRGDIVFEPAEAAAVGFCIRLKDRRGRPLGREVCWNAGEHDRRTMATVVLAGTQFTFEAKRLDQEARFAGSWTTI